MSQQQVQIVTVLKCLKCGYSIERPFREGDFVPKIDGTCPNDGSPLFIWGIYAKSNEQKK
ncbi:MAG: hypothetical protein RXQ80_03900 [Sulfolobaceae archaeon]|jgi:hypothetical protein|nr:hypothetical protein [Stygiolobus sp.]MDT7875575.1 hypothetical protein [Sulfolobaceae archaeon]